VTTAGLIKLKMSYVFSASLSLHEERLASAYNRLLTQDSSLCIVTREGDKLCLKKDLLLLHSPLLRALSASITPESLIILPQVSTGCVQALHSLLIKGEISKGSIDAVEVEKAANLLGVDMQLDRLPRRVALQAGAVDCLDRDRLVKEQESKDTEESSINTKSADLPIAYSEEVINPKSEIEVLSLDDFDFSDDRFADQTTINGAGPLLEIDKTYSLRRSSRASVTDKTSALSSLGPSVNAGINVQEMLKLKAKITCKAKNPHRYFLACKKCPGCKKNNCGKCRYCRDMRCFKGNRVLKKKCVLRICENPRLKMCKKCLTATFNI